MARPPKLSGKKCRHCGSNKTCKAGFGKHRKPRFYCRGCRRFFVENPFVRPSRPRKWKKSDVPTPRQLLLELKSVAKFLGRAPVCEDWRILRESESVFPIYLYYQVFGSFLKAKKLAGLKPNYMREFDTTDRRKLLDELRRLQQKLGRPLIHEDVSAARRRREVSPPSHFYKAFGSVPIAIKEAGAAKTEYERDELIAILREMDSGLDRPVQLSDIQEGYDKGLGPSVKRFMNEFENMTKARSAAGIKSTYEKADGLTPYWQKYSKDELIQQLTNLMAKLGKRPTDRDINDACKRGECASSTTFANMFGSLVNAYMAAGFENVKPRSYTDDEIESLLRDMVRKKGRMPTFHELRRASMRGECPSPGTIVRRIGKLTEIRAKFESELNLDSA